jgi:putative hydrolase of the HAD superfamily
MSFREVPLALVLDYGGVICVTTFERQPQIERKLGLAPGTLRWRGPFDPDSDAQWRDMLAYRISEREYWRRRAAEIGRLIGEEWTDPRMLMAPSPDEPIDSKTRPEALAAVRAVRAAGRNVGVLSNELDLFHGPGFGTKLSVLKLMHASNPTEAVADALGAPIERCLMVDDQPRNIDGALAAGMQAEWFDVTRPAETYARVLARLGIEAAENVG